MTVIAAMAENRVIGKDNAMPWHVSEDLLHFKEITTGGVLIMGRKTFESIGCKPLRKRPHVVVSRTFPETPGVDVCRTFEAALEKAGSYGKPVFSVGGAEIYRSPFPSPTGWFSPGSRATTTATPSSQSSTRASGGSLEKKNATSSPSWCMRGREPLDGRREMM